MIRAALSESPVWVAETETLWWIDIDAPAIHRLHLPTGQHQAIQVPETIGFLVRRAEGGFTAGFRNSLATVRTDPLEIAITDLVEPDRPQNRINDGKADPSGRLWFGTMHSEVGQASGSLYLMDPGVGPVAVGGGFRASNGPAFSPDGALLYHCDTMERGMRSRNVRLDGSLGEGHVFLSGDNLGWPDAWLPDGMTVDAEGGLWVAVWGGRRVCRFEPDGRFDRAIRVPASQVTSCTFGGSGLCDLFITTAAVGLSDRQVASEPQAGGLFCAVNAGTGLPSTPHKTVSSVPEGIS